VTIVLRRAGHSFRARFGMVGVLDHDRCAVYLRSLLKLLMVQSSDPHDDRERARIQREVIRSMLGSGEVLLDELAPH
jgi:hypothetical protein